MSLTKPNTPSIPSISIFDEYPGKVASLIVEWEKHLRTVWHQIDDCKGSTELLDAEVDAILTFIHEAKEWVDDAFTSLFGED